jgi:hypothetical protein
VLIAVTLTFSTMGFLTDITVMDEQPFSNAVYSGVISGLTATTVLLSIARGYVWLLATAALQLVSFWFLHGPALEPPFVFLAGLSHEARLHIDCLTPVNVEREWRRSAFLLIHPTLRRSRSESA